MRTLAALLGVPLLFLPAGEPSARGPELLAGVPEDAFLVLHASELEKLVADLGDSAWGELWADDELAPLREWLDTEFDLGDGEGHFEPLLEAVRGSVAVYAAGESEDELRGGVLIDPGDGSDEFDEALDALLVAETEGEYRTLDHAGVDILLWSDEEELAMLRASGFACVLFARDAATLEGLARGTINRYLEAEPADALANSELFREARDASPYARVRGFADTRAMAAAFGSGEMDEQGRALLRASGLGGVHWATLAFDVGAGEELDVELRFDLPEGTWLEDVLDLGGTLPLGLARLAPADAVGVGLGSFDLSGLVDAILDLVLEVDPDALGVEDPFDAFEQMVGLDVRGEFLDQLTGDFGSFELEVSEEDWLNSLEGQILADAGADVPEGLRVGSVFVFGVEDPDAVSTFVEDALDMAETMTGLGPFEIDIEDAGEFELFTLGLDGEELAFRAAWYFGADYGVFSVYPGALRTVLELDLDADQASALDSPTFAPALRAHGDAVYATVAPTGRVLTMGLGALQWIAEMGELDADFELPDPSLGERLFDGALSSHFAVESDSFVFALSSR